MVELPRSVAFQSKKNSKFLRFIPENSQQIQGNLRFSGDGAVSPFTKFEVERAKNTKGSLVHIRCSYNNKYLCRETPNDLTISASADEPNENHCEWSCTMFEPIYVNEKYPAHYGVRFRHVQSMKYVCLWQLAEPFPTAGLYAGSADPNSESSDVVTFIDLDSLVILPKLLTFRGDNGLYLQYDPQSNSFCFSSNDLATNLVVNNVYTTDRGSVVIKPLAYFSSVFDNRYFWQEKSNSVILSDYVKLVVDHFSPINTMNIPRDIQFEPIKVGDNKVALRSPGFPYPYAFCRMLTDESKVNRLASSANTISNDAIFEVSEAILWREVYNVKYQLTYSKLYKQDPVVMSTVYAENISSEPKTQVLKFSVIDTTTTTWRNSVSLKLGVKVKFEGGIPQVVEGNVIISSKFKGTFTWAEDNVTTQTLENAYKVTVPAKSRIKVSMLAIQISCEVPFSYTQRDMLIHGDIVAYEMDDGVYTFNSSNFYFSIGDAESLV